MTNLPWIVATYLVACYAFGAIRIALVHSEVVAEHGHEPNLVLVAEVVALVIAPVMAPVIVIDHFLDALTRRYSRKDDPSPSAIDPVVKELRPMKFLSLDFVVLREVETGADNEAAILHLDDANGEPDALMTIALCRADAEELYRQLHEACGPDNYDGDDPDLKIVG